MIGNDIVDLRLAQKESNWNRPRFLQKIFTPPERCLIDDAPDKNLAVWLLWSRKESAYKIIARAHKRRFVEPKKFESFNLDWDLNLTSGSQSNGAVRFEDYTIYTKSTITESYIHSVARLQKNNEGITARSFYIDQNNYSTQHQVTQQYLLSNYSSLADVSVKELSIQKNHYKVPDLYRNNRKEQVMISTSHHGHYGGFVLQPIL